MSECPDIGSSTSLKHQVQKLVMSGAMSEVKIAQASKAT